MVFKGGTSLSKAFGLIERFSEDVDVLVVVTRVLSKDFGKGSIDKILKAICLRAGEDLGLGEPDQILEGSGKGEHRNVRYRYPTPLEATVVQAGVLLEMGVRGGPNPSSPRSIRSFISAYAVGSLGLLETEYEEFAAFDVQVLNPERTLFEKLAILHHLASNYPESEIELRRAAGARGRARFGHHRDQPEVGMGSYIQARRRVRREPGFRCISPMPGGHRRWLGFHATSDIRGGTRT